MNPAPLSQPAPFTCHNCGASLESKPEFCPRCGERLKVPVEHVALNPIAAAFLIFGCVVFGAMGVCGGYVAVDSWRDYNSDFRWVGVIISTFCLLVGLIGFRLCLLPFLRRKR